MRASVKHFFVATVMLSAASAGLANAQRVADVRGVHFGGALDWTTIKIDETGFTDDEREKGIGINLYVGYNFTRNLGLTLSVTPATMEDGGTNDYEVGHIDLGGRVSFPGRSAFVPYLELALTAMGAEFDTNNQETKLEGGGISLGGGFNYFFSRRAAFDASFRYTIGEFTDIEINGVNAGDVDELGVNTTRLNIGLAFYP
jgi:hypothetical protein